MKKEKMIEHKIKKKKTIEFYVDPEEFSNQIVEFYNTGIMTDGLGDAIYNIAYRMGFRPRFINYTYKEDMIGDAMLKMVLALKNKNFDPKKGNAFSYFSKITWHAFFNRIKKEKKSREIVTSYQEEVYNTLVNTGYVDDNQNINYDENI
jgi:DNA-directed RNA polymerase specialized sigma24 family protein